MAMAVDSLIEILDLEKLGPDRFQGFSPQVGWQRVYGGQVVAQSLAAASRTVVEDRLAHSLHSYFLRPGDPKLPILYDVERIRDGASFTTRQVIASQHGKPIFLLSASFQVHEDGLSHQVAMPDVPHPDQLPNLQEMKERYLTDAPEAIRRYFERRRPIELRPVDLDEYIDRKRREPVQHVWFRTTHALPIDQRAHQCSLAYASDMTLLDTALYAHGLSVFSTELQCASLDHAIWFHRPIKADDWLLYSSDSPSTSGARGFSRGSLFDVNGNLVASTTQEGLNRLRRKT